MLSRADEVFPDPITVGGFAAVAVDNTALAFNPEPSPAGLAGALVWADRSGLSRLVLFVDDETVVDETVVDATVADVSVGEVHVGALPVDSEPVDGAPEGVAGQLARMAKWFSFPIEVRVVVGASSRIAEAAPFPTALPADDDPELATALAAEGLERVVEQGIVRGEVLGLEVARLVRWPKANGGDGALHLEAGVGRFDRDASAAMHGPDSGAVSLARAVGMVRAQRFAGAAGHPIARMARDRWLRVAVVDQPELVGAKELASVESTVRRPSVRDLSPAAALGTTSDGVPLMVVCTAGVDLSLVPVAADTRELHSPGAQLKLAVPDRDRLQVVERLAELLVQPAEVVAVPEPWGRA